MKILKAICTTAILALALTVPAYAGDIGTPGSPNPGDIATPASNAPAPSNTKPSGMAPVMLDLLLALAGLF